MNWPEWTSPDGRIRLINADALDVLPTLAEGSIDAVITSPPYNQLGSRLPAKPSGMHAETRWVDNTRDVGYADDMPEDAYQEWLNGILAGCAAAVVDGGSVFVNHKCRWRDTVLIHPVQWLTANPARLRQEIIWRRAGSCTLNARMFAPNEERILWFVRGKTWKWNQPAASWLSVWEISQDRDPNGHPCPYPVELPRRCILGTTDREDVVLEPFSGSATTAVACIRTNRRCIAIEKEPKYFEIGKQRVKDEYARTALFNDQEELSTC